MKMLRLCLSRLVALWLVTMIVAGSLGMSAGMSAQTAGSEMDVVQHAMTGHDEDCPMGSADPAEDVGHAHCAMSVCCVSSLPAIGIFAPDATPIEAKYSAAVAKGLTQSDPELAKKPPKPA